MTSETSIIFNVGAGVLLVGIVAFFMALLAVIWKARKEISDAIAEGLDPVKRSVARSVLAIDELQVIIRQKFPGISIANNMLEQGSSPLNPTEFGASLIKDSGLEKILDENKVDLHAKFAALLQKNYTEYDVQERAREILISLKDDAVMNPVKEWVYDNPTDIDMILRVGGLWLRDDFLGHPRKVSESKEKEAGLE